MDRIFGEMIRVLRVQKGISQQEAALFSGLSQPEWSKLEDGSRWPQRSTYWRLSRGLGISVREFFERWAAFIQQLPDEAWEDWNVDGDGDNDKINNG